MQEIDSYYIPKTLDDPEQWLWFTIDEAILIIVPVITGIIVSHMIIGFICGLVLYLFWRRLKRGQGINIIIYAFYWYYPEGLLNLKSTPPSYIRSYYG